MTQGREHITPLDEAGKNEPSDASAEMDASAANCESSVGSGDQLEAVDPTTTSAAAELSVHAGQISWNNRRLNPSDFTYLFETYAITIRNFIYGLLHNSQEADDLTQQVFTQALGRVLDPTREPLVIRGRDPSSWLFRIAQNLAYDSLRMRRTRQTHSFEATAEAATRAGGMSDLANALTAVQARATMFEDQVAVGAMVRAALDAMNTTVMGGRYREALIMYYIYGFNRAEIARVLGVPEGGLRMLLMRARQYFIKQLQDDKTPA